MSIIKGIFGGKKESVQAPPIGRISAAPGQSEEEINNNRSRMEAELAASRAARDAKKATE